MKRAFGFVRRCSDFLRQSWCGVFGHDYVYKFGRNEVYLQCLCGHRTTGWNTKMAPPREVEKVETQLARVA